MNKKIFFLLFLCLSLWSCERDDICAAGTPTTPQLLVEFLDVIDQETLKNVPRLAIYPEILFLDETNNSLVPPTTSSDGTLVFNANENSASLPLIIEDIDQDITVTTRYIFEREVNLRIDNNTSTTSNIDIVEISYKPVSEYVSRACGFKSVFTELRITVIDDGDNWIISNDFPDTLESFITVENENATHVQFFH